METKTSKLQNQDKYYYSYCKVAKYSLEKCFKRKLNVSVYSNYNMFRHDTKTYYKPWGYSKGSKVQSKIQHFNISQVSTVGSSRSSSIYKQPVFSQE